MAPHDCSRNDMNLIDVTTYEEQQPDEVNDDNQQVVLQRLQLVKEFILTSHNLLQQFEQTQEYMDEELEPLTEEYIEQRLQQLRLEQQKRKKQFQEEKVNKQTQQQPQINMEVQQLFHELAYIVLQIQVMELREDLMQIQHQDGLDLSTQQQINHQKILKEITHQNHLQQLKQGLQDLQQDIQLQIFNNRINVVCQKILIPEQTQQQPENQQIEDELQELKHQLNILLVKLQRIQIDQLLQQVQQELNKQQRYPIQYQRGLQVIEQHIDRIKQLKQQPMPGKQQLSFLAIVLFRQLDLQQQLNFIRFQLHVLEFEQQIPYVEKQIDNLEKQLQQLQPEQQLLQQLESVKKKSKSIHLYVHKQVIILKGCRKCMQGDLERPKTTKKKILNRKIIHEVSQRSLLKKRAQSNMVRIHQGHFDKLKQVQLEIDELKQQIDQQPLQL